MRLTKIDRLERVENILQRHIDMAEKNLAGLTDMKESEIMMLKSMYLMDLGKMQEILTMLRRRIDLEYAINKDRRDFYDEIRRFASGGGMGERDEKDLQRADEGADTGRGGRDGFPDVGRDDEDLSGDDEGRPLRGWQISVMQGNGVTLDDLIDDRR